MARFNIDTIADVSIAPSTISAEALFELGLMYSAGRDVETDMISAHKWFNLAALRGNAEARFYRTELSREMPRRDVVRAQREAREWLKRH